jgi:hypothetical protein
VTAADQPQENPSLSAFSRFAICRKPFLFSWLPPILWARSSCGRDPSFHCWSKIVGKCQDLRVFQRFGRPISISGTEFGANSDFALGCPSTSFLPRPERFPGLVEVVAINNRLSDREEERSKNRDHIEKR